MCALKKLYEEALGIAVPSPPPFFNCVCPLFVLICSNYKEFAASIHSICIHYIEFATMFLFAACSLRATIEFAIVTYCQLLAVANHLICLWKS